MAATQARWVNCGAGRQAGLTTGLAVLFHLMPDPEKGMNFEILFIFILSILFIYLATPGLSCGTQER